MAAQNCYCLVAYLLTDRAGLCIDMLSIFIDFANGGTWEHIMELVEQDTPPALIQSLLAGWYSIDTVPGVEQLYLAVKQFCPPVGLFDTRLRGVGAAMMFQVQCSDPAR